jgi:hypothetical protein
MRFHRNFLDSEAEIVVCVPLRALVHFPTSAKPFDGGTHLTVSSKHPDDEARTKASLHRPFPSTMGGPGGPETGPWIVAGACLGCFREQTNRQPVRAADRTVTFRE